jgi:hypothetical protein
VFRLDCAKISTRLSWKCSATKLHLWPPANGLRETPLLRKRQKAHSGVNPTLLWGFVSMHCLEMQRVVAKINLFSPSSSC